MKIITINLPLAYFKALQILQDLGIYPSRSEAIRYALREFLEDELMFQESIEDGNYEKTIKRGGQH